MIKIEKEITITINGNDVKVFNDVCEAARLYLYQNKTGYAENRRSGMFDPDQFQKMTNFLDENFS
uniref:Uncharacterized protein n=1 Tax=viral metagenome TaxID=1070528 RepID=A0A6M3JJU1_9ZZZZ